MYYKCQSFGKNISLETNVICIFGMDVDYVPSRDLIQLLQPSTYLVLQLLNDSHHTSLISRDSKCCNSCGEEISR